MDAGPVRVPLQFSPDLERAFGDERLGRVLPQVRAALFLGALALAFAMPISDLLFPGFVGLAHTLVAGLGTVSLIAAVLPFVPGVVRWLRPLLAVVFVQFVVFPPFLVAVGDPD